MVPVTDTTIFTSVADPLLVEPRFDIDEFRRHFTFSPINRTTSYVGTMMVEIVVEKDGHVGSVEIIEPGNRALDEDIVKAIQSMRFTPATRAGVNVRASIRVPLLIDGVRITIDESITCFGESDPPRFDTSELRSHIEYPERARRKGVEGTVMVRLVVERNGTVSNLNVASPANAYFDRAAIDAVMKTTFFPGELNGIPLRVQMTIPVKFELP